MANCITGIHFKLTPQNLDAIHPNIVNTHISKNTSVIFIKYDMITSVAKHVQITVFILLGVN